MSNPIERPIFFEGQILGAVDLQATVEYHRGANARHNRYLHIWGIVNGLDAEVKDNPDVPDAKDIKIKPGVAIDGTGREIVLADAEKLVEDSFKDSGMVDLNDANALYPVFLSGSDTSAPQPPLNIGSCSTPQPIRKTEAAEVTIGRPSDVLDTQPEDPDITLGPRSGWRVLLGFVKWDKNINKFVDWKNENSNGVARRYAGVRADVVEARGGKLSLRTGSSEGQPAVLIDKDNKDKTLQFGMLSDLGGVTPVFSISSSGDVIAEGTISGAVTAGSVQIQSGVATDGVILPLPSGMTEEKVTENNITLHIYVTPRFPGSAQPTNSTTWVATPKECSVDLATRKVSCLTRWFEPGTTGSIDVPAACNYMVIASVPAPSGG